MSGIFFDIASLPVQLADYLRINPMAVLIESYRKILPQGIWPDWGMLALVTLFGAILTIVSFRLHMHFDRKFPKIRLF